jgi:hypothetical protein
MSTNVNIGVQAIVASLTKQFKGMSPLSCLSISKCLEECVRSEAACRSERLKEDSKTAEGPYSFVIGVKSWTDEQRTRHDIKDSDDYQVLKDALKKMDGGWELSNFGESGQSCHIKINEENFSLGRLICGSTIKTALDALLGGSNRIGIKCDLTARGKHLKPGVKGKLAVASFYFYQKEDHWDEGYYELYYIRYSVSKEGTGFDMSVEVYDREDLDIEKVPEIDAPETEISDEDDRER